MAAAAIGVSVDTQATLRDDGNLAFENDTSSPPLLGWVVTFSKMIPNDVI